jgi:integrase/recombinase XerD
MALGFCSVPVEGKTPEITIDQARRLIASDILAYLDAAGIKVENKDRPLFRSTVRKTKQLTANALSSKATCEMVKRRLKAAKLPDRLSPHSFRVTAINDLQTQGVPLEDVKFLAGHSSPRTVELYDRRQKKDTWNIVERISI